MKYMALVAVAAGLACGVLATTPADYVQDGLVVHFDAVDNEGTGTHNPSATKWKDLKGSAYITLVGSASWVDGKYLDTTPAQHTIYGMPAYNRMSLTVETAVNIMSNGPLPNTSGSCYPRIFANYDSCSIHFSNTGSYSQFFLSGANVKRPAVTFRKGTISGYSGSERYAVAVDGVEKDTSTYPATNNPSQVAANWTLNGYSGYLHGHYYGFRLYNRMLSANEIKRNSLVDRARYLDIYPLGYRDNPVDGRFQQAFCVSNLVGGTVTVDGTPLQADFEEWSGIGTETTHTLTATPAEGYIFIGWKGDTGAIASGSYVDSEITATSAFAVTLSPMFLQVPVPSNAEPVITIRVDAGVTTVLDDWLAATNVTIGTTGTIVKEGGGTLQVTNDIISSFAGEFVFKEGRWLADTRTALGVQTGGDMWVENGATLHLRATTTDEVASQTLKRKVYIKGTGWNGKGALYGSNIKNLNANNQFQYLWPKYITLLGDARLGLNLHMNMHGLYVDMNRYTLTVAPTDCDWDYISGGCWSNGTVTITSSPVVMQGTVLRGGAENTLRFTAGSGICTWAFGENKGDVNTLWTIELASGASIYARGGTSGWSGPVVLEGDTKVISQTVWSWMYFWGPISGPGNIGKTSNPGSDWTYTSRGVYLKLDNPTNSFTGGIWLKYNILEATRDGAIPANGGAVNSFNSTIKLTGAMEYHLPDLALSGTGIVQSVVGARGAFRDVSKTDSETITWSARVGAKSFALNAGTLKFGTNAATNDEVVVDFGRFSAVGGTTLDLSGNAWTCTNLTGAAALVDGALTVDGPWTLDAAAAGTLGGGTATVAFGPNTELTLANESGLNRATVYTIATSSVPFPEKVPLSETSRRDTRWRVRLSADGTSQELFYAGGAIISFR